MVRILNGFLAAFLVALPITSLAFAQDILVEKKTFELSRYTTVGGTTIKDVKIGWEAAGTLTLISRCGS